MGTNIVNKTTRHPTTPRAYAPTAPTATQPQRTNIYAPLESTVIPKALHQSINVKIVMLDPSIPYQVKLRVILNADQEHMATQPGKANETRLVQNAQQEKHLL